MEKFSQNVLTSLVLPIRLVYTLVGIYPSTHHVYMPQAPGLVPGYIPTAYRRGKDRFKLIFLPKPASFFFQA